MARARVASVSGRRRPLSVAKNGRAPALGEVDAARRAARRAPRTTTGSSGRGRKTARHAASSGDGRKAAARPCPVFGRKQVGKPLAEGVADLGDDAGKRAALIAVEEADRVEHVAENAEVRQEQDPVGLDPDARSGRTGCRGGRGRTGWPCCFGSTRTDGRAGPARQLVEVEQVEADAVAEDVLLGVFRACITVPV